MTKQTLLLSVLSFSFLVGCQSAAPTETPPPPTVEVLVVPVIATQAPTDTPTPTASPTATTTFTPAPPTQTSTPTRTPLPATLTRPRPTATRAPTPTPPDTLQDGSYSSTGTIRVQFIVSGGGTLATGGFFNYHCPADGALSTYGFTEPAAIVGGKFAFSALPASSGEPQVTLVCSPVTLTQARCAIRNLLATKKCLDTPVTATRK